MKKISKSVSLLLMAFFFFTCSVVIAQHQNQQEKPKKHKSDSTKSNAKMAIGNQGLPSKGGKGSVKKTIPVSSGEQKKEESVKPKNN